MNYTFFDVEDRAVAIYKNFDKAFVWWSGGDNKWVESPGLVGKTVVDGIKLDEDGLKREFPDADISLLPH